MNFFETLNLELIFFLLSDLWMISYFFSDCVLYFILRKRFFKNIEVECWPVIYKSYSLKINVLLVCFLLIWRPLSMMGCFHLQNVIWNDHYPVSIVATAICVARYYLSESLLCLLSERTELVLYIFTSCVSEYLLLGKTRCFSSPHSL